MFETVILTSNSCPFSVRIASDIRADSWEIAFKKVWVRRERAPAVQISAVALQCNLLERVIGAKYDYGNFALFFLPERDQATVQLHDTGFLPISKDCTEIEINLLNLDTSQVIKTEAYSFYILAHIRKAP